MNARTRVLIGAGVVSIGVLVWWTTRNPTDTPKGTGSTNDQSSANAPVESVSVVRSVPSAPPSSDKTANAFVRAAYGSKKGELGRDRPQEGNPEGPSSLAFAGKDLVVLDQVNSRGVRYDSKGNVLGVFDAPHTAQEIAVGPDGTMAMMDRLAGKTITLTDPSGKKIGELPLKGDTGLYTGVFFDGKDIYVEKEHGSLSKIGTSDGAPADEPTTLQGRPSRDGTLLLTATLAAAAQGKVTVNAFDRKKNELRFARLIQVPAPAHGILLLDTDGKGVIYLGVGAGDPEEATIACMDPKDGKVLGRVQVPLSDTPDETFRDFTVSNEGVIAYALRTDEGVTYQTAHCP